MCEHRGRDPWSRLWGRILVAWIVSFLVPEVVGLIRVGPEATLSHYLQRRAGVLEPCRHTPLGRFVILTACAWLAAHIGWGKFGTGVLRPHSARTHQQESPRCLL